MPDKLPDALPNPDLVAALPRLRRYARVLTGDLHRADDLVQDTLARAWEKRRLWQAGSDLRAWLFTIMHNVYVNQFSMRSANMRRPRSTPMRVRPQAGRYRFARRNPIAWNWQKSSNRSDVFRWRSAKY